MLKKTLSTCLHLDGTDYEYITLHGSYNLRAGKCRILFQRPGEIFWVDTHNNAGCIKLAAEEECSTLELICLDPVLDLEVVLVYSVFEDVDAVTRSALNAPRSRLFLLGINGPSSSLIRWRTW